MTVRVCHSERSEESAILHSALSIQKDREGVSHSEQSEESQKYEKAFKK